MGAQYDFNWESSEDRDVLAIMDAFRRQNQEAARAQFAAIGRTGHNRTFLPERSGVGGYLGSRVHPESFHYWGQRLGYACWNDPGFVREYLRDNDYARVENRPRQTTVRVPEKRGINFRSANFNGMSRLN